MKSRAGDCDAATAAFEKAGDGKFLFQWQEIFALNSAARVAESRGDLDGALSLYRKSFELAPLNPRNTANMMHCYWRLGKILAASAYAQVLRSGNLDSLIRALLNEYDHERSFGDAAGEPLHERQKGGAPREKMLPMGKLFLFPILQPLYVSLRRTIWSAPERDI